MKKILTIIMGFMLIGVDVNASPLKIELELFRDDDTPLRRICNPAEVNIRTCSPGKSSITNAYIHNGWIANPAERAISANAQFEMKN